VHFLSVSDGAEIIFDVEPCAVTGGYGRAGMPPVEAASRPKAILFGELDVMTAEAVAGYFEPDQRHRSVRLTYFGRFSRDKAF
jgi:hypothetical protein